MRELLEEALNNQSIISICVGKVNWDRRILGYVKAVKKNFIHLDIVDIWGSVIKQLKIDIAKISVIETDDTYNQHIQSLKVVAGTIKSSKAKSFHSTGKYFRLHLENLIKEGTVCTLFAGTEYITGIIRSVNDSTVKVDGIGYMGKEDGKISILKDKITRIRINGRLERKITYLKGFK